MVVVVVALVWGEEWVPNGGSGGDGGAVGRCMARSWKRGLPAYSGGETSTSKDECDWLW